MEGGLALSPPALLHDGALGGPTALAGLDIACVCTGKLASFANVCQYLQNFGGLVLGCIEVDFSKQINFCPDFARNSRKE